MEDIRIVHLGDLGQNRLTEEQLDTLGEVDILMVPVGGIYTLDAKQATEITNQIEPKIVIPMHYKVKDLKVKLDPVDNFLKEVGKTELEKLDKFTIKQKDLLDLEGKMEVIVFKL